MTDEILRTRPRAYFILESQRTNTGEYRGLFALEGVPGYYQTNYSWGKDKTHAMRIVEMYNKALGLDEHEAMRIIFSSMKSDRIH